MNVLPLPLPLPPPHSLVRVSHQRCLLGNEFLVYRACSTSGLCSDYVKLLRIEYVSQTLHLHDFSCTRTFVLIARLILSVNMLHRLMVGTWTQPGNIYTIEFDDEALTLKLLKKTSIPHDEPISWMTFDVSVYFFHLSSSTGLNRCAAREKKYLWSFDEKVVQLHCEKPNGDNTP